MSASTGPRSGTCRRARAARSLRCPWFGPHEQRGFGLVAHRRECHHLIEQHPLDRPAVDESVAFGQHFRDCGRADDRPVRVSIRETNSRTRSLATRGSSAVPWHWRATGCRPRGPTCRAICTCRNRPRAPLRRGYGDNSRIRSSSRTAARCAPTPRTLALVAPLRSVLATVERHTWLREQVVGISGLVAGWLILQIVPDPTGEFCRGVPGAAVADPVKVDTEQIGGTVDCATFDGLPVDAAVALLQACCSSPAGRSGWPRTDRTVAAMPCCGPRPGHPGR